MVFSVGRNIPKPPVATNQIRILPIDIFAGESEKSQLQAFFAKLNKFVFSMSIMNWYYTRIKQYILWISVDWEENLLAYPLLINHTVLCLACRSLWQDNLLQLTWVHHVDESVREQMKNGGFVAVFLYKNRPSQCT